MDEMPNIAAGISPLVPFGRDCFGEYRGLGISRIDFKVRTTGETGLLVIENTFHGPGGPARHLHVSQDEWFYAIEGDFVIEIGDKRTTLNCGDSVLAPRGVAHVWAFTGSTPVGRLLIAFLPAGKMEGFFREVTRANAMPPLDPKLWQAYGMELLGPPMSLGEASA